MNFTVIEWYWIVFRLVGLVVGWYAVGLLLCHCCALFVCLLLMVEGLFLVCVLFNGYLLLCVCYYVLICLLLIVFGLLFWLFKC